MTAQPKVYLTKRSNGFYYVGYLHEGRKRWKSTRSRKRQDALQALREFEELVRQRVADRSFTQFSSEFLDYAHAIYRLSTVKMYQTAFKHFIEMHGNLPLSSLTLQHIDIYKARRTCEVSPATVNIEIRCLKAALSVAVGWGLLPRNPFQRVKQVMVPDLMPVHLSRDDFGKLLTLCKRDWLRQCMIFAVFTGLRQGEMLNLRWQDVDFDRRLITVQSSPTFRTKQGKRRVVPMGDVVAVLLRGRAGQPMTDTGANPLDGKAGQQFVFTHRRRPISKSYIQHCFKRLVREASLDDRLHWHSLRHTHATWLVETGATLYEVQRLLGHSSPRVTEIYSHLLPEHLHKTVNRIELPLN